MNPIRWLLVRPLRLFLQVIGFRKRKKAPKSTPVRRRLRFNLEQLEARALPGEMISGLGAALIAAPTVTEALYSMTNVVGPDALAAPLVSPTAFTSPGPSPSSAPVDPMAASQSALASTMPEMPAAAATPLLSATPTPPTPVDSAPPADISMTPFEPIGAESPPTPQVNPPADSSGGGGGGGSDGSGSLAAAGFGSSASANEPASGSPVAAPNAFDGATPGNGLSTGSGGTSAIAVAVNSSVGTAFGSNPATAPTTTSATSSPNSASSSSSTLVNGIVSPSSTTTSLQPTLDRFGLHSHTPFQGTTTVTSASSLAPTSPLAGQLDPNAAHNSPNSLMNTAGSVTQSLLPVGTPTLDNSTGVNGSVSANVLMNANPNSSPAAIAQQIANFQPTPTDGSNPAGVVPQSYSAAAIGMTSPDGSTDTITRNDQVSGRFSFSLTLHGTDGQGAYAVRLTGTGTTSTSSDPANPVATGSMTIGSQLHRGDGEVSDADPTTTTAFDPNGTGQLLGFDVDGYLSGSLGLSSADFADYSLDITGSDQFTNNDAETIVKANAALGTSETDNLTYTATGTESPGARSATRARIPGCAKRDPGLIAATPPGSGSLRAPDRHDGNPRFPPLPIAVDPARGFELAGHFRDFPLLRHGRRARSRERQGSCGSEQS